MAGTKSPSSPGVVMEKRNERPRGTRLLVRNHFRFSEGLRVVRRKRDSAKDRGPGGPIGRRRRSRQASAAVLKAIWTCELS
jgi:hypothetical protein